MNSVAIGSAVTPLGMCCHLDVAEEVGAGTGMTSLEVAEVIDASWPESVPRLQTARTSCCASEKGRRLRDDGAVLSPAVGNGHTTSSTWILNKDRWSDLE